MTTISITVPDDIDFVAWHAPCKYREHASFSVTIKDVPRTVGSGRGPTFDAALAQAREKATKEARFAAATAAYHAERARIEAEMAA